MRISDRLVFFFYQSIKLLLIPVGIHTISSIFQAFDIAERQADWVTTKARVTQSQNVFIDDTKRCRFKYEYVADKQQFSNWRYSADGRKCAGTAKFKTSNAISIYYDPDNPASSVVERLPPSAWFLVTRGLGGLLTIGVGLYTVAPMIADLLGVGRMLHNAQNSSEPAIHKR